MTKFIATFGYSGLLKPAPGTWGSALAVLLAWPIHAIGGPVLLVAVTVVAFFLGKQVAERHMALTGEHDPSEITIDEAVGQWIALLPVSLGAVVAGTSFLSLWPGILVAFAAFRALDIFKPGPVGWADSRNDAWGVMLDDVVAGWIASLIVAVAAFVFHGMMRL